MEQLINFIIRPPRAEYDPKEDLLDEEFMLKGKWYHRKDLEVTNSRGDVLQCSHYMPIICPEGTKLPCVIYCHGNSGCRTDASEAAVILLPSNITVFTLDFSGSGLSGGEHVTLGWNEKDDLKAVVDYLRADGNVSLIGLWGRSMGAVTSMMYGAEDPSIAGMVLDSPFSDLVDLMMELVDSYKVPLPKFTVKFAIHYMRRAIQKKAKFDILELNTIKVAKSCFVPVLFGHAIDDDFIQPHHSDNIFDAYVGDKNIIKFEGDHNSPRPQFYFDSVSIFFNNVLQPPEDDIVVSYFDLTNDDFSKGRWSTVHDEEFADELLDSPVAATSTEDTLKQLRSKKPMSTVVVPVDMSSNDNQPDSRVESRGSDSYLSPSNMISFELSEGSGHGSHAPGFRDDNEYVEHPLNALAGFPINVEEEERMFTEAVIESLKDLEARQTCVQKPSSSGDTYLPKPEQALPNEKTNSFPALSDSLETSVSTSATLAFHTPLPNPDKVLSESPSKCSPSSGAESQETSSHICSSTCNHSLPDNDTMNCSKDNLNVLKNSRSAAAAPRPTQEETSRLTSHKDASSATPRPSSEVDMVDSTTVTVKVEKNTTSNVIDGWLRRWELFFRNR
ncbi:uncharacterized protein LOC105171411 isoform X3 [Sesamum indicum]|uniref:Uncharacterized protein LOC105171411 isoform X3 n=2 Tax=Sesamum indicum TaxID=4182 RepID=A0A6I9UA19_SESIN|nr:uncharacterized protein LOC105171411 isoform X3 [Sesamum indicum]